ncbi:MAG: hypothetical protein INR62_04075 [Rhodospirillales bacterium]|nr:hypothetical protein [Acetobacter sp.]
MRSSEQRLARGVFPVFRACFRQPLSLSTEALDDSNLAMHKRPRLSLEAALHLYWRYLIGAAVFPVFLFVGQVIFTVPPVIITPLFLAAMLTAMWPFLAKDAPHSFWTTACGVLLAGGIVGSTVATIIRVLLPR